MSRLRILVLSTVFPSALQPVHGLFVAERLRHAARAADLRVLAPIAWFRRWRRRLTERRMNGIGVAHPWFFYVPGIGKVLDGLLLFISVLPAAIRLRREFRFDVVDAHYGYPEAVAAVLLGWWFETPVVITLRGTEIEFLKFPLRRAVMGWAIRRADRIIAVSGELGRLAVGLGANPSRVTVILNGVDTVRFKPVPKDEARRRLGIDQLGPLIVSVGRLVPGKGFHRLLEAIPDLRCEWPSLQVAIVGGAVPAARSYPGTLRKTIERLDLVDCVHAPGAQAPDQIACWMSAADLFVLATDREGCPNVVWEAMACGCPVVVTKVGSVEDMVPDYAGLLLADCQNRHALVRTIDAALRRKWDSDLIRAHACRHGWEQVGSRVVEEWRLAGVPLESSR